MRSVTIALLAVLCACNTAGPGFRGAPAFRAEARDDLFLLRRAGAYVEAQRINPRALPRFPPVAEAAAEAAFRQTGCVPAWVKGDPSKMLIGLSCGGGKPPTIPKGRPVLICDLWDGSYSASSGRGSGLLDCAPG